MSRINVANFRHPDGTADNITFDSSTNATVAGNLTASGNLTVNGTGNQSIAGTLQFNSGYGSAATAYGVRAWINFDGTSGSIGDGRADGNMDAVTDHGTGTYSCNFTTDMPDANYIAFGSVIGSSNTDATNGFLNGGTSAATAVHSTSAFRFITLHVSNGATDYNQVQVGVIR